MIKRTIPFLLVAMFCFSVHAQTATPDAATRDFYRWYIGELNAEREPLVKGKTEMRRRLSQRLARWVFSRAYSEYGADYFLDAQDYDESWAKTVSVSAGSVKGNTATVVVTMPKTQVFDRTVLNVSLVREGGAWKIDKVRRKR